MIKVDVCAHATSTMQLARAGVVGQVKGLSSPGGETGFHLDGEVNQNIAGRLYRGLNIRADGARLVSRSNGTRS